MSDFSVQKKINISRKLNLINTHVNTLLRNKKKAQPKRKKPISRRAPRLARAPSSLPREHTEEDVTNVVFQPTAQKTGASLRSVVPPTSSAYIINAHDLTSGSGTSGTESTVIWLYSAGPCSDGKFYIRRVNITQSTFAVVDVTYKDPPFTVSDFNDPSDVVKINHASFKAYYEGALNARMGAFVTLNPPRNTDLPMGGVTLGQLLSAHAATPTPANYNAVLNFVNGHRYSKRYPVHKGACEEIMPVSLTWFGEQDSYACVGETMDLASYSIGGTNAHSSDRAIMFTSTYTSAATYFASCSFTIGMEIYINDRPGLMSGATHAASQAAQNVAHTLAQGIFGASHDPMLPQSTGMHQALSNVEHKAGKSIMRFLRSKKAAKVEEDGAIGLASLVL